MSRLTNEIIHEKDSATRRESDHDDENEKATLDASGRARTACPEYVWPRKLLESEPLHGDFANEGFSSAIMRTSWQAAPSEHARATC